MQLPGPCRLPPHASNKLGKLWGANTLIAPEVIREFSSTPNATDTVFLFMPRILMWVLCGNKKGEPHGHTR
jgi:hypothetical protein